MNRVITLLTDFGLDDEYVGVMKGVILSRCPSARIVDLCHAIAPQNIAQAARMLRASTPYFPPHTIHVAVVDPGVGTGRHILLVEMEGQKFIAPDNGLLTPLLRGASPLRCFRLETTQSQAISSTFHGRDIMAPAAAALAAGTEPSIMGRRIEAAQCVTIVLPEPKLGDGLITGEVTAVDHFGNVATSIRKEHLAGVDAGWCIVLKGKKAGMLRRTYADVPPLAPLALINSRGELEVAVRGGNAARFFACTAGDEVTVVRTA